MITSYYEELQDFTKFSFCRLQEKNVKEKQVQHWKAVIALQERLQTNQHRVSIGL